MTTFVSVTVEDRSCSRAEDATSAALLEMERLAALLTRFDAGSPLGVLNALATAVFVLGAEAGCRFVSSLPGVECLLLLRDGSRRASAGWLPA